MTPYGDMEEIRKIKYVQSADVMILTSPDHPVMELRRTGAVSFELREFPFKYPAVMPPNTNDALTIKPSGVTGTITLTASNTLFQAGHAGSCWELLHVRSGVKIDHKQAESIESYNTNGVEVKGYWSFTTHGTWTATVKIQRSEDGGVTYLDFRTFTGEKDLNVETSGEEEEDGIFYRVHIEDYTQAGSESANRYLRVVLDNSNSLITGVVKITSVTNGTHAAGTVLRKLGGTSATKEWNEGAWSSVRGYPRAVSFYQERLFFGGTEAQPNTLWGSRTNAWDNFLTGPDDDNALDFLLASDTVNGIQWLLSDSTVLVIGTSDSEWVMRAADGGVMTAGNCMALPQSRFGSDAIQGVRAGDVSLFVQRSGRKIREYIYNDEKGGYVSRDLTIMADHITSSGVREAFLQQQPDVILWCILNDGTIAALTYDRVQEICGWHRHDTDGEFLSGAVLPEGDEDRLCFAVRRGGKIMIEEMGLRAEEDLQLDCCLASGTVPHLAGRSVHVLEDGADAGIVTVPASGVIEGFTGELVAGLDYTAEAETMPWEGELADGPSLMRSKRVGELRISVYRSVGGEAAAGNGPYLPIFTRSVLDDDVNAKIKLKSETYRIVPRGGWDESTRIRIRQSSPFPLHVISVAARIETAN